YPAMSRCRPHAIAQRVRAMYLIREHGLKSFVDVAGAAIGQSGNNGAASKNLRVCYEHNRSHGAASREAGHEYFPGVRSKCLDGALDHLPYRKRLTVPARDVAW